MMRYGKMNQACYATWKKILWGLNKLIHLANCQLHDENSDKCGCAAVDRKYLFHICESLIKIPLHPLIMGAFSQICVE